MNEIQPQFKVEHIPEAVGLSFEYFDFVVESFQRPCRDTVFEVGKETLTMSIQGLSQFGEMLEAQGICLVNPVIQECGSELFVGQIPKGAKVLFEEVSGVESSFLVHNVIPFKIKAVNLSL